MEILLERKWVKSSYIIGRIFIDGKIFCNSMEPPRSCTHPCIPAGRYKVVMYPSKKFGMRPILLNVKGRSGILIHEGNYPHNTSGCILVGINSKVGMLTESKLKLSLIMKLVEEASETFITIKECS